MHERLPDPCIVSYGETNFSSQAECLPPTDGQPTLVLLGDSHGSALAPHLRDATVAHGWHFAELTKSSCPPLEGTTRYMHLHPDHARECMEFNRSALAWVLAHTQVKAVVLAGYWLGPFEDSPTVDAYVSNIQNVSRPGETESLANFRGGLNREIGILMQSGKEVLLVQDVPHLSFDPALMELTRAIPLRRKLANLVTPHSLMQQDAVARIDAVSQTEISFAEIVRSVAKENRTDVLETPEAFCNELSCSYGRDGYSFYFDPQHLSALGSQVALKDLPPGLFDGERKPTESDLRSRASAPIH
nr:SGNH hydrolase domain-containing protein [Granulicella aggregans]